MIQIKSTTIFKQWLDNLKDLRARAKIQTRIKRLQMGNFGDVKPVGEGVSELRITNYGRQRLSGLFEKPEWRDCNFTLCGR